MALNRRAGDLEPSADQLQRPRVINALAAALPRGVPTAAGWLCLAQLHRRSGNAAEAWAAAREGLAFVNSRLRLSKERYTQAGLALRLEAAQVRHPCRHNTRAIICERTRPVTTRSAVATVSHARAPA